MIDSPPTTHPQKSPMRSIERGVNFGWGQVASLCLTPFISRDEGRPVCRDASLTKFLHLGHFSFPVVPWACFSLGVGQDQQKSIDIVHSHIASGAELQVFFWGINDFFQDPTISVDFYWKTWRCWTIGETTSVRQPSVHQVYDSHTGNTISDPVRGINRTTL